VLRLPLTWIGILHARVQCDLAASGGVQSATDALKLLMAGASVTMMCSALLRSGIETIRDIERDLAEWMEEHEYESVEQMQGSMSQRHSPDPSAFERAQYMRAVSSYQPVV
jgi:dihydroorotate dehydrogenase (fumarate)